MLDPTQQPTTSGSAPPVQTTKPIYVPMDRNKSKEVHFDKALKKDSSQGLDAPYQYISSASQYSSSHHIARAIASL